MRVALCWLGLTGCVVQGSGGGGDCTTDDQCNSGFVCARGDRLCVTPSEVREVTAHWTINGGPATTNSCDGRDLFIDFQSDRPEDSLGFAPVPCFAGQFSVDALPLRFTTVELGVDGGGRRDFAAFDGNGEAQLDLAF